ncbi:MAG: hypothetical protein KKF50_00630 [Nanoarchaeota archaeon]|nr:hypothetical protein [Nanoarchaeota archaeon]
MKNKSSIYGLTFLGLFLMLGGLCTAETLEPYRLQEGILYPNDCSYDGIYPNNDTSWNGNLLYAYIHFIALSKNPTSPAAWLQTGVKQPYFRNLNNNGNNESLKVAWTSIGGTLTIEPPATITVNFDNNPITIYFPINQTWKKSVRLTYNPTTYDAYYLYVSSDGSTYWNPELTELAAKAPDSDGDGVSDSEDLCPDTIENQIIYGCSCSQILELKPGKDKGELKNGCSKGTIKIFTEQLSWAKI